MTCKTSKTPGPAIPWELPKPDVFESNANWLWMEWDRAQAGWDATDDMSDFTVSQAQAQAPLIRTIPRDLQRFQDMPPADTGLLFLQSVGGF